MGRGECALAVQISYASTSAALSDRSAYPNLFRTIPSDEPLAPALATVLQYYGWRTLSILTEQESQFIQVSELEKYSINNSTTIHKLYIKYIMLPPFSSFFNF